MDTDSNVNLIEMPVIQRARVDTAASDRSRATAIRYDLIAVGIAIAFVAAVQLTGTVVKVEFKPHGIVEFGP